MWVVYEMQCVYCAHRWVAVREYDPDARGITCPRCQIIDPDRGWPEPDAQTQDMREKPVQTA